MHRFVKVSWNKFIFFLFQNRNANQNFHNFSVVEQLKKTSLKSEDRISKLESRLQSVGNNAPAQAAPAAAGNSKSDDDDGVDLFGSDSEDEDEAAVKLKEQRLAEYAAKKSKSK